MLKLFEAVFHSKMMITGLCNTLIASLIAIGISTLVGILLGVVLTYGHKVAKIPIRIYVDVVRGLPSLVIVFTIYYFIDFWLRSIGHSLSPFTAGFIALSVNAGAHVTENVRGALQSIPKGQVDAGKAIGMRFGQILIHILIPQALVRMLPPWMNTITEIVKGSTLLSLIGVAELILTTQQLIATNNNALFFYTFVGVVYLIINIAIECVGKFAEKKIGKGMNV